MDPLSSGFLPGAAVKFLRSGTSSANFVLFNELNPLPDQNHNLFAVPLTNHVGGKFLVFDFINWSYFSIFWLNHCEYESLF